MMFMYNRGDYAYRETDILVRNSVSDNGKLLFDVPDDKKSNTDIKESLGHFADVIENLDSVDNLSTSKYDNPDTPHIQTLSINVQFTPEEYE